MFFIHFVQWCRSGRCLTRGLPAQLVSGMIDGGWSLWSEYSECASGCLQEEGGGVGGGSTGIMYAHRLCNNPRPENGGNICSGSDRKYRTCFTNQVQLNLNNMSQIINLRNLKGFVIYWGSKLYDSSKIKYHDIKYFMGCLKLEKLLFLEVSCV